MTEIGNFHVDFVKRTRQVLEQYDGEYDFTNLINRALGLIVLPHEKTNAAQLRTGIWEKSIFDVPECPLKREQVLIFKPIHERLQGGGYRYWPETLGYFLKKLRNGFAHVHLIAENKAGKWVGIRVRNYYPNQGAAGKVMDLDVTFTWKQLQAFALFVSDEYLKMYTPAVDG